MGSFPGNGLTGIARKIMVIKVKKGWPVK